MSALALAGSVRWVLDLFAWLIDTLINLQSTIPSTISLTDANKLSLPDLLAHLHSTNNVALHILLASSTRGFLTAICRRLAHLDYIARRAIIIPKPTTGSATPQTPGHNTSLSPALRAAYLQIAAITSNAIVGIKTIESLLSSLTNLIRASYKENKLSGSPERDKSRNNLEIKMVFGSSFPDAFKTVIVELFKEGGLLDIVRGEIDPAKLFFADFEMLEVDEDSVSVNKRKGLHMTMDCFRKGWMMNPAPNGGTGSGSGTRVGQWRPGGSGSGNGTNGKQGARWRRCARCAAAMEDVPTQRQSLQWLIMQQRRCFCSGYFDTIATGQTFA